MTIPINSPGALRRLGQRRPEPPAVVQHPHPSDPASLTDARARVDDRLVGPRLTRPRVSGVPLALVVADLAALVAATAYVRPAVLLAVTFGVVALVVRSAMHVYRSRLRLSALDEAARSLVSAFVATGLTVLVSAAVPQQVSGVRLGSSHELTRLAVAFLIASLVLSAAALCLARQVRCRRGATRRTLIIGAGRVGGGLGSTLLQHPELGLLPVGFLDPDSLTRAADLPLPLLSKDLAELPAVLAASRAETVIMAFSTLRESQVVDTVITAHQTGCSVLVVPRMFELHHDSPDVERVRGIPLIRLRPDPTLRPSWWIKRTADVLGAALALLVLSPVLLALSAAVLLGTGRPLLFWQERIGLDGRVFRLCKFRSMQPVGDEVSQAAWSVQDDPRMTAVGSLLRRTSLDELPQLVNILRGEMSFVGPRPERPGFVQQFTHEHERYWARHRVPVGLTGLAQVNGLRGDTSIRERARYDNYYIANWSLWLDVRIALLTVREVLAGGGR